MKIAFIFCLLALAVVAGVESFESKATPVADVQKALPEMVRSADCMLVDFHESTVEVRDPEQLAKFQLLFRGIAYEQRDYCMCISYPQIHVYRGDKELFQLSVHHGGKLRFAGSEISGDYWVGEVVGSAVVAFALSNKQAAHPKSPLPVAPVSRVEIPKADIPPNKALVPTVMPVTPAADAPVAPATTAAHL